MSMSDWQQVPTEPTKKMIEAGCRAVMDNNEESERRGRLTLGEIVRLEYKAMLKAALQEPEQ